MKNKSSIMISLRLPKYLYDDLKNINEKIPDLTMSKLIIFATCKDIQRYKEILKNGNSETI